MSYKQFISNQDLDNMNAFVGDMIVAPCEDTFIPQLPTVAALEGIQLYSRQITSFTTLAALGPISQLIKVLHEDVNTEAGKDSILKDIEDYVKAAVQTASENISLTTRHLREYCEEHGIDFDKTPYA